MDQLEKLLTPTVVTRVSIETVGGGAGGGGGASGDGGGEGALWSRLAQVLQVTDEQKAALHSRRHVQRAKILPRAQPRTVKFSARRRLVAELAVELGSTMRVLGQLRTLAEVRAEGCSVCLACSSPGTVPAAQDKNTRLDAAMADLQTILTPRQAAQVCTPLPLRARCRVHYPLLAPSNCGCAQFVLWVHDNAAEAHIVVPAHGGPSLASYHK